MKILLRFALFLTMAVVLVMILIVLAVVVVHPTHVPIYVGSAVRDLRQSMFSDDSSATVSENPIPPINSNPSEAPQPNPAEAEISRQQADVNTAAAEVAELRSRNDELRNIAANRARLDGDNLRTQRDHRREDDQRPHTIEVRFDIHVQNDPADRAIPPAFKEVVTQHWVEPIYTTVSDQIYEPEVYRTTSDRVWREPTFRTISEWIFVPNRYEVREMAVCEHASGDTRVERRRVLVSPTHYENVTHRTLLREGRWEEEQRKVLVREGGCRQVERRKLLTPGHYENRTTRVEVTSGQGKCCD